MNVTIRNARESELEAIGELIRTAYSEYEPVYQPESWQRFYRGIGMVRNHFERGAEVIVAEVDGELAASITFYTDGQKAGQGEWPEGWAGMVRLAVLPRYRGRGLSRMLVEECLRRCREHGVSTVGLHTTEWMATARAMYERMGFVRVPDFDFFPPSGIVAYGYRLDLYEEQTG